MYYENKNEKTIGLLYKDYLLCDHLLVLLHGKIITIIDINEKAKKVHNLTLNNEKVVSDNFYQFNEEPIAVWLNDKPFT